MKIPAIRKLNLPLYGGIIALIVCLSGYFMFSLRSEKSVLTHVQKRIEKDFSRQIRKTQKTASSKLEQCREEKEIYHEKEPETLSLVYDETGTLRFWNNSELLPSLNVIDRLPQLGDHTILRDENKLFYALKHEEEDLLLISLIPIHIGYSVENQYLYTRTFLGRYDSDPVIRNRINEFEFHTRELLDGINIRDDRGEFAFAIKAPSSCLFVRRGKSIVFVSGVLAFILLAAGLRFFLKKRIKPIYAEDIFIAVLIIGRLLMIKLGLPGSYVEIELFSPDNPGHQLMEQFFG